MPPSLHYNKAKCTSCYYYVSGEGSALPGAVYDVTVYPGARNMELSCGLAPLLNSFTSCYNTLLNIKKTSFFKAASSCVHLPCIHSHVAKNQLNLAYFIRKCSFSLMREFLYQYIFLLSVGVEVQFTREIFSKFSHKNTCFQCHAS